ncbi:MAG: hypothetical protein JWM95_5464 [Gemmatimonadetes bacterium]|nr:hypothetical protein [Gemmatimonadota bacterium]
MLARRIAHSLRTECVPEASRIYAERVGRELTEADVEPIAREHMLLADAAAARVTVSGGSVLVLDTDLVSTSIYGKHYYDFTSPFIEAESRARQADVYLLCDVDVPWVPDGVRDRPVQRAEMFALFRDALAQRGAVTVVVCGGWQARGEIAVRAVQGCVEG